MVQAANHEPDYHAAFPSAHTGWDWLFVWLGLGRDRGFQRVGLCRVGVSAGRAPLLKESDEVDGYSVSFEFGNLECIT